MNKYYVANDFNRKYHLIGRLWTLGAVLLFIAIPLAIGIHYGVKPDWKVFGTSAVIIPFIITFLSGIVEPILYAPMLGTNSEYLAFVTGNLSNLKIPCVVKAHEIYPTENGTEEHEVISTIAVATSTLVTVVIIAILVLCLAFSNLQGVVERETWIMPAFSCVVYALFGSLGGKYIAKNPKLSIIPAAIVVVLSIILGVTKVGDGVGSAYLFVGIAVCLLFAILQIMREKRKQRVKEEEEHLAGIADTHEIDGNCATATTFDAEGTDIEAEATALDAECSSAETNPEAQTESQEQKFEENIINISDDINVCADNADVQDNSAENDEVKK